MCKGHLVRGQGESSGKPLTAHVTREPKAEVEKKLEGPAGPQAGLAGMWPRSRGAAGSDVDSERPALAAVGTEDLGYRRVEVGGNETPRAG